MKPAEMASVCTEHEWVEGGARDFGRYHCRRCFQCLSVPALLRERDSFREALMLALNLDEMPTADACRSYIAARAESDTHVR